MSAASHASIPEPVADGLTPANDNADPSPPALGERVRPLTPTNENRGQASIVPSLDGMIRDLARLAADLYFEGKLDRQGAEPDR
jgi:hypothetical protein